MRYLLGIETSCDDTAVAIVAEDRHVLANVVSSQHAEHQPFGGVVPELASRAHLRNLPVVFRRALDEAGLELAQMSAVAVTTGPGLLGSLMVGVNFAKALAFSRGLPLIGVNHIRGHARALTLEHGAIPLPALALIVSGGHTHLLLVESDWRLVLLTKTRDDSAGEAFDKLAKMLNLGFPGGPAIDRLARDGDPLCFNFSFPRFSDGKRDFSFSGVKSAAARYLEKDPETFADREGRGVKDLAASFQKAIVHQLLNRVRIALEKEQGIGSLLLAGGVACNSELRREMTALGAERRLPVLITSPKLCTDNAAMIAAEGWALFKENRLDGWDLSPDITQKPYDEVRLL